MNYLLNKSCGMGGNLMKSIKTKTKTSLKYHEYVQKQTIR